MIFDRSWYNRAGVETVMGFCSDKERDRFLELCQIEKFLIEGGIILIKLWLEVGNEEQKKRFEARIDDPVRQWKLSPHGFAVPDPLVRLFPRPRSDAGEDRQPNRAMAPRSIGRQKTARLNTIEHILSLIPFKKLPRKKVKLSNRSNKGEYDDEKTIARRRWIAEGIESPQRGMRGFSSDRPRRRHLMERREFLESSALGLGGLAMAGA